MTRLLYQSGTGKTALARAVAADLQFAFFAVNGPELVSEHLGHSEACLRAIFLAARSLAPTVSSKSEAMRQYIYIYI